MSHNNENYHQEFIHENELIHRRISEELRKAKSQVLLAMGWFTDPDLFQLLLQLAEKGADVRVVIDDHKDNRKLDFRRLKRAGAKVYKADARQYGGMRHRFCIFDRETAIYGSYYWTVNARRNNQESVLVTNFPDTVKGLISQFEGLEAQFAAQEQPKGLLSGLFRRKATQQEPLPEATDQQVATVQEQPAKNGPVFMEEMERFRSGYGGVLDEMIAAEIFTYDRDQLRSHGDERAAASNGDAQLLGSALDTVYAQFVNDINTVEDKKLRLIGRIREHHILYDGLLERSHQAELRHIESEAEALRQQGNLKAATLKMNMEIYRSDMATLTDDKITAAESKEKGMEAAMLQTEQQRVKPGFKWHEFVPVVLFGLGLLFYLVLFYSSAVYIMLYSERDTMKAMENSGSSHPPVPQIFESQAWHMISNEGRFAIFYVLFFVVVPVALMVVHRLASKTLFGKPWVTIPLAVILDVGVAYKVTASIYKVNEMVNGSVPPWKPQMAFVDPNFYLVFLLGSLPLIIFGALFNKLITLFEERAPEVADRQLGLQKEQELATLNRHRNYLSLLRESVSNYKRELIRLAHELHVAEMDMAAQPHLKIQSVENAKLSYENNRKVLNDVTAVYIARVEHDAMPISLSALKDRINVFLDGWTRFLNREYAEQRASERTSQALQAALLWQEQKINGNLIDPRIN